MIRNKELDQIISDRLYKLYELGEFGGDELSEKSILFQESEAVKAALMHVTKLKEQIAQALLNHINFLEELKRSSKK